MASYESSQHRVPKDLLDGTWGTAVKVTVSRYDSPDGEPVKVGSDTVRALSLLGATTKGARRIREIIARDQARRTDVLTRKIARLKDANAPPGDNDLTSA